MSRLANAGEALAMHARLTPDKIGASDLDRRMSFRLWHQRACRLANALTGLGLGKGDRVAVLAYNAIEWLEIYAATALAGLVAVPVNFRLTGAEARYIIDNCEARALIVQDELLGTIEAIRADLAIASANIVVFGKAPGPAGFAD
jgi:acyl-CoA synthetase (AMP-forming)/AMP-acid ligase II